MVSWFKQLDELLRGHKTGPERLAEGRMELPLGMFAPLAVVLGATYGFFMGWYAVFSRDPVSPMQVAASMVKLPALFLVTLVVTLPSLYVFNALVGCRLSFIATVRLLVGAIVVNLAVAAAFGPILGFFTFSTTSYPFMILLNVVLLAIAGMVGLAFLLRTLRRLGPPPRTQPPPPPGVPEDASGGNAANATERPSHPPGALDPLPGGESDQALGRARSIFRIWVIIYGLVGAQTGWLLRPFIGSPALEFTWLRQRDEGNFFLAVWHNLQNLLGGS